MQGQGQFEYNANFEDSNEGFEVVPAGIYTAVIEEASLVRNSKDTGDILKLTYQILEGSQKGKKIFNNLNIVNQNATAQRIAQVALNSIMKSINLQRMTDTSELLNRMLCIDVKIQAGNAQYPQDKNIVMKHSPAGAVQSQPVQQQQTYQQLQPPPQTVNPNNPNTLQQPVQAAPHVDPSQQGQPWQNNGVQQPIPGLKK